MIHGKHFIPYDVFLQNKACYMRTTGPMCAWLKYTSLVRFEMALNCYLCIRWQFSSFSFIAQLKVGWCTSIKHIVLKRVFAKWLLSGAHDFNIRHNLWIILDSNFWCSVTSVINIHHSTVTYEWKCNIYISVFKLKFKSIVAQYGWNQWHNKAEKRKWRDREIRLCWRRSWTMKTSLSLVIS